eukprot:1371782-Prymnesium_polylepis.1
MQRRTVISHGRVFPAGLRTDSSNMDPLMGWRAGFQMVALNLQTNDLATQLHQYTPPTIRTLRPAARTTRRKLRTDPVPAAPCSALFELSGGHGYVLKPVEMRTDVMWPPARKTVRRVTVEVISLHQLPARGEHRPETSTGKRSACHQYGNEYVNLSGLSVPPKASAASLSSPSVALELHAIVSRSSPKHAPPTSALSRTECDGFCCVSDNEHPKNSQVTTRFRTRVVEGNGLVAEFGQVVHCLAAEPRETILRVVVQDGDAEVAYDTAVLGVLRDGYRCFQLRSPRTGTRIQLCSLLVHIAVREVKNLWAEDEVLRRLLEQQQAINEELEAQLTEQRRRNAELELAAAAPPQPAAAPAAAGELVLELPASDAAKGTPVDGELAVELPSVGGEEQPELTVSASAPASSTPKAPPARPVIARFSIASDTVTADSLTLPAGEREASTQQDAATRASLLPDSTLRA